MTGELAIGGVQLAQGYLGQPQLTTQKFPVLNGKRWYLTGDFAVRDHSGVFHCLGRIDNQIKVSGYRIELEEIDAALRQVSGRDLVGTVAWPIADGAPKGIVGFVAGSPIDHAALTMALKQKLPTYMVPNRVIALEIIPLNSVAKLTDVPWLNCSKLKVPRWTQYANKRSETIFSKPSSSKVMTNPWLTVIHSL